jgi:hypothetical protein
MSETKDLASRLSAVAAAAFEKLGFDVGLGATRRSDRTDRADFQCNGAMVAAKAAKRNPREIAGAVAEARRGSQLVARASGSQVCTIRAMRSPFLRPHRRGAATKVKDLPKKDGPNTGVPAWMGWGLKLQQRAARPGHGFPMVRRWRKERSEDRPCGPHRRQRITRQRKL